MEGAAARREEPLELVLAEPLAGLGARQQALDVGRHDGRRWYVILRRWLARAGDPGVCPGIAFGIDRLQNPLAQRRIKPALACQRVGRIDCEPLGQRLAGRRGLAGKCIEVRPRRLGIDVVLRHRRDAAPVVDPRRDQLWQRTGAQVGRRLDIRLRPKEDAGCGDGPEQFVKAGLGRVGHARPRLRAEVLDDDLLDVPMRVMGIAERKQGLDALLARLADADEDAGGEGHRLFAGQAQCLKPRGRSLVRRAVVGAALGGKPFGRALEHHALRGRDLAQRAQVFTAQHAGIEMRQQRRLFQHQRRHGGEVGERALVTEDPEPLARRAVAEFRLVAEGEQGLLASGSSAGLGHAQHLVRRHERRLTPARWPGEGAVVADVATEMGERDEDLARIRHDIGVRPVAQRRRAVEQRR